MKALWTISILLLFSRLGAQDEPISIFKDTRIVNSQSSEVERKGFLKFIISHRFGAFNDDFFYNFFGLDNANVRLGLDYGINDNITIGAGRTTIEKTFDGFLKWKFKDQTENFPIAITGFGSIVYRTERNFLIPEEEDTPINRLSYSAEVYVSKLVGDRFAVQLTPTFTYRNLVADRNETHAVYSQGFIAGYKLSKKVSINLEYFFTPDGQVSDQVTNPLSLGFDFGTNGHVFQLFVSNSQGMNAPRYVDGTTGTWIDGDIFFGFNISRVFRIKAFQ